MRLSIIFIILFLTACSKEKETIVDANGVTTKLSTLWGISISNNGKLAEVIARSTLVYDDENVLVGANRDNNRFLCSLNSNNGKMNWMWGDLLAQLTNPSYIDPLTIGEDKYHIYNKKLSFIDGGNTYLLSLLTGKTVTRNQVTLSRNTQCSGFDNLLFTSGALRDSDRPEGLYMTDLNAVDNPVFVTMPIYDRNDVDEQSVFKGMIGETLPFKRSGDILIAVLFSDPGKTSSRYSTAMGLYNFSQKKWVYERAPLNGSYPNSNVSWAKLYNDKVYHTSTRSMQCNDVMTGKLIWSVNFDQGFGSSGFVIQDGKIFGNNDNRFTYCLDLETGRQIWKEESSGSASPISYLNGVLYFMGGGDGRLHAIDANTGKHLWRLRSPDVDKNSGAFFYGTCVAVPGQGGKKGRVVATTGLNAYGYEAIR